MIALTVYWYLGQSLSAGDAEFEQISTTMAILQDNFVISPWLLLIPVFVIFLVTRKVPALPALFAGILLGFLSQIFIQGGSVAEAVKALQVGFSIETGNDMVDGLFNRGGLESMMYTVSMTIVAMTLGGILENTGMLKSIVEKIISSSKSAKA